MKSSIQVGTRSKNRFQSYLLWLLAIFPIMFLFTVVPALAVTADGFVTKIDSPTEFDVGTLHLILNAKTSCEDKTYPAVKKFYSSYNPWTGMLSYPPASFPRNSKLIKTISESCDRIHIEVGSSVHLFFEGAQDGKQFMVARVVVDVWPGSQSLERGAVLEETPSVYQVSQHWVGIIWIDGYPISITPKTRMLTAPAFSSFRYGISFAYPNHPQVYAKLHAKDATAEFFASLLKTNTCVTYHAMRAADGSISAIQLRFWPNHVNIKEKRFLTIFKARIIDPDYKAHTPGSIQFKGDLLRRGPSLTILPDRKVQDWVSNLGMELVPQYQKSLSDVDATKIHFRFYVVKSFWSQLNGASRMSYPARYI